MKALDALAAMCVRAPDDAYAVATRIDSGGIEVFLSSNHKDGVPSEATKRLGDVWRHLQIARLSRAVTALVRQHKAEPAAFRDAPQFTALHRDFITDQYRYSWTNLKHRASHDIAIVLNELQKAMTGSFSDIDVAATPGLTRAPQEHRMGFLRDLSSALQSFQKQVLECRPDDDLVVLHTSLQGSYEAVQSAICDNPEPEHRWKRDLLLTLSRCTRVPVRGLVHDAFALVSAITHLTGYCHMRTLSDLLALDASVTAIDPVQTAFSIDPRNEDVAERVRDIWEYDDEPDPHVDADYTSGIVQPLEAKAAQSQHPPADEGFFTNLHPEALLLQEVHQRNGAVAYIGTSGLSCLGCYRLFEAHNKACEHPFLHQGSHGVPSLSWTVPVLSCSKYKVILYSLREQMREDFIHAARAMYRRRKAERRVQSVQ
ncbi:hypothetical protein EXIGLDRAFT_783080 [Exidia glandulosa HHB12029]|uniref:C2H2-type domain-containing protein n=1 Tax=Exidia glandulosa HHB12029 TaxID=1314781 RepID=A0A166N9N6_EXIGL|nr:hypothetical protein EXIGLDRAFT_783080 [Exidia glandulosa HHB12029]